MHPQLRHRCVASAFTHLLLCAAVFPCAVESSRAHLIDLVMYGADEQTSRLITKQLHRLQQMAAVKQCVATVRVSSADLRDDIEDSTGRRQTDYYLGVWAALHRVASEWGHRRLRCSSGYVTTKSSQSTSECLLSRHQHCVTAVATADTSLRLVPLLASSDSYSARTIATRHAR